jgi:flagellar biosynthesis/type III secretory pathway ATPase
MGKPTSSAEYVEDVNSDSVVIVDGLTKVLRYSPKMKFATNYSDRTGDFPDGVFAGL